MPRLLSVAVILLATPWLALAADPYVFQWFSYVSGVRQDRRGIRSCGRCSGPHYVLQRGEHDLAVRLGGGKFLKSWGSGLSKSRTDYVSIGKVTCGPRQWQPCAADSFHGGRAAENHRQRSAKPRGADGFRAPDDLVFDSRGNIFMLRIAATAGLPSSMHRENSCCNWQERQRRR